MIEVFESRIEEYPSWTDQPWDMHFTRVAGDKNVEITVCGSRGGVKARFHVRFVDLDKAVAEINPAITGRR